MRVPGTPGGDFQDLHEANSVHLNRATKQRLVLFTPGLDEPGGAQRRSRLIAEGLAHRGWEVKVITRNGKLRRPLVRQEPGLTVVEVPGFERRRLGALLYLGSALPAGLIWGMRATAFLSVQLMSTTTVAGVCALLHRRPFLAFSTVSGELGEIRYLEGTRFGHLRIRLLRQARFLVAQTPGVTAPLEGVAPAERVAVMQNPVEVQASPAPLSGSPTALFAGRFAREKDLMCLLQAWSHISAQNAHARLTLAGAGGGFRSIEPELREAVIGDENLNRSVHFPGWLSDVAGELGRNDVFVLPSRDGEGMSNALLEACAAGRVVVASDIEPNRAVLGDDYPLLFRASDTESLAK